MWFFRICLLLVLCFVSFPSIVLSKSSANCLLAFEEAAGLYDREQYLLSSVLFRQLKYFDCDAETAAKADYGLMLGMYQLDERGEVMEILSRRQGERKFKLFEAVFVTENSEHLTPEESFRFQVWQARQNKSKALSLISSAHWSPSEKDLYHQQILNIHRAQKYSVLLASGLSIVPGLGQLYVGAWSSAFVSVFVNALFGWATYEFYSRNFYGAGSAAAFVTSITYFGNIVQAGRLAHAKNQTLSSEHETEFRNHLFGDLLSPH